MSVTTDTLGNTVNKFLIPNGHSFFLKLKEGSVRDSSFDMRQLLALASVRGIWDFWENGN
jgi:hypothetical protein